jgi:hypothetical protein
MITLFDLFISSFTAKESKGNKKKKKRNIILIEKVQAIIITVLLLLEGTCQIVEWTREKENDEQ